LNAREFYDYIMENFNLGGTASRLVGNIVDYVEAQGFVCDLDARLHLNSLLGGAFGLEESEINLYSPRKQGVSKYGKN